MSKLNVPTMPIPFDIQFIITLQSINKQLPSNFNSCKYLIRRTFYGKFNINNLIKILIFMDITGQYTL